MFLSDIEWSKERFFRETVVAVGMVGRYTALIAEEEVRARPLSWRSSGTGSQVMVYLFGSPTPGQSEKESSARLDRLPPDLEGQVGSLGCPLVYIVQNLDFGAGRH
jgi:hypothetical protein